MNGVIWDGSNHFFANAFVIQVRSSAASLRTRSSFADRFEGLLALQCNCDGPVAANWDALPRGEQRRLFGEHFHNWFQCARTFTESTVPFAQVLLFVQGTGVFRFTVETRLPPSVLQVREHFDAFLAPRIGNGVVEAEHRILIPINMGGPWIDFGLKSIWWYSFRCRMKSI